MEVLKENNLGITKVYLRINQFCSKIQTRQTLGDCCKGRLSAGPIGRTFSLLKGSFFMRQLPYPLSISSGKVWWWEIICLPDKPDYCVFRLQHSNVYQLVWRNPTGWVEPIISSVVDYFLCSFGRQFNFHHQHFDKQFYYWFAQLYQLHDWTEQTDVSFSSRSIQGSIYWGV